jgi:hypothetical protein
MGIAKTGKNVKMLLDIGKVLTSSEIGIVSGSSETEKNVSADAAVPPAITEALVKERQ